MVFEVLTSMKPLVADMARIRRTMHASEQVEVEIEIYVRGVGSTKFPSMFPSMVVSMRVVVDIMQRNRIAKRAGVA
jgi:hypothetical protein